MIVHLDYLSAPVFSWSVNETDREREITSTQSVSFQTRTFPNQMGFNSPTEYAERFNVAPTSLHVPQREDYPSKTRKREWPGQNISISNNEWIRSPDIKPVVDFMPALLSEGVFKIYQQPKEKQRKSYKNENR